MSSSRLPSQILLFIGILAFGAGIVAGSWSKGRPDFILPLLLIMPAGFAVGVLSATKTNSGILTATWDVALFTVPIGMGMMIGYFSNGLFEAMAASVASGIVTALAFFTAGVVGSGLIGLLRRLIWR